MKKARLFFATIWALLLTLAGQAHAKTDANINIQTSDAADQVTPRDKMRAKLVDVLVKRDVYAFENAFLYVEQLSDDDVRLLLSMANDVNLKQMAGTGVSGRH